MINVIITFTGKHTKERESAMYKELIADLENGTTRARTVSDAESLADKVLSIGGYMGISGPIPIVKIAKEFGITTFKERNMPVDVAGNIFVGGTTEEIYHTDKVIVVGDGEEYFHQRFIIAHELAHYLMDYLGNSDYRDKRLLFSKTYPKQHHNSDEEIRADRFAAELLMPKVAFLKEYVYADRKSNGNDIYVLTYLSTLFKTKKSSIERRIIEVLD